MKKKNNLSLKEKAKSLVQGDRKSRTKFQQEKGTFKNANESKGKTS